MGHMSFWCGQCMCAKKGHEKIWTQAHNKGERRFVLLDQSASDPRLWIQPPSIGLLVQKVKEQESKVTVVAYAIMSEFEPKHQNLHTLKNRVLKKYFKNWPTTLEFLIQFGIPGCWQKDLSVILWLILKCWWEESCTSLSTGSVSRVDVCIAGVQEAPDQNDF